ncbi:MAG TPA: hypothetical protein VMM13_01030, partial [Euzebya sp.]|nr:hypothetical protein [Euzebya sp.]
RSYIAEDPAGGDVPIAVGVTVAQVTGDGDGLQQQVVDAYGACAEWDNSLSGGGSEPTEVVGVERVAVGPYEGVRSRIRFPSDGQVIEETRVVADGVWLTVQVDGDRIAAADRDHVLAVLLTNLSRLS